MLLTNDISDIYLTPLSANHLLDQRSYNALKLSIVLSFECNS